MTYNEFLNTSTGLLTVIYWSDSLYRSLISCSVKCLARVEFELALLSGMADLVDDAASGHRRIDLPFRSSCSKF